MFVHAAAFIRMEAATLKQPVEADSHKRRKGFTD
jgi:hypothetical protein